MIIKKQLSWLAIIVLGLPTCLFSISSYRLIQAPNGKLILILGDIHGTKYKPYADIVIKSLKAVRVKKPLPVVIEMIELHEQKTGDVIVSEPIKAVISLHKSYKNPADSPVSLSCCEPRGHWSEVLENFRDYLCSCGLALSTRDERDERYGKYGIRLPEKLSVDRKNWNEQKTEFLQRERPFEATGKRKKLFTISSYLEYLEHNRLFLEKLRGQQKDTVIKKVIDKLCSTYVESYGLIKKEVEKGDTKDLLSERLMASLARCENSQELLSVIDNWYLLYIMATDYLVINAALFDRIALSLEDERPLCIISGDFHAIDIATRLTHESGWKLLEEEMATTHISLFANLWNPQDFDVKLAQVMDRVLEPLKDQVKGKEEVRSKEQQVKCCVVCRKTEQLKVCCNQVYYCGTECQKKAWKEHKPVCQKIKVKPVF